MAVALQQQRWVGPGSACRSSLVEPATVAAAAAAFSLLQEAVEQAAAAAMGLTSELLAVIVPLLRSLDDSEVRAVVDWALPAAAASTLIVVLIVKNKLPPLLPPMCVRSELQLIAPNPWHG